MRNQVRLLIVLLLIISLLPGPVLAQGDAGPTVQAVLFYSPTCPHCHIVINEVLMPMLEQYGGKLQIIGIDTTQPNGQMLYQSAIQRFEIPQNRLGVPTLIVGETVLVGSQEIPSVFPGIVEAGLTGAGIPWPDIPGLSIAMAAEEETAQSEPAIEEEQAAEPAEEAAAPAGAQEDPAAETVAIAEQPILSPGEGPTPVAAAGQPDGFELAAVVLILMVLALGIAAIRIFAARQSLFKMDHPLAGLARMWAIPLLAALGLGVSAYLAYIEITLNKAICGPVGDCNAVQASEYARIAGIPIAVLGLVFYVGVVGLWALQGSSNGRWANLASRGLLAFSLFGVVFSIYLTLLELFVIHAICAWCLSSALITTALMLLALWPLTDQRKAQAAGRQSGAAKPAKAG